MRSIPNLIKTGFERLISFINIRGLSDFRHSKGEKDFEKDQVKFIYQESVVKQRSLSYKILAAQEDERRRISRGLHDDIGQILTALKIHLGLLEENVEKNPAKAVADVHSASEYIDLAQAQLRFTALGLHPPALEILGLNTTLKNFCEETAEKMGVRINYQGEPVSHSSHITNISIYRVVQEIFSIAIWFVKAENISMKMKVIEERILLTIVIDGNDYVPGIDLESPFGIGVPGMQERMELLGGTFEIQVSEGGGTVVSTSIPLD